MGMQPMQSGNGGAMYFASSRAVLQSPRINARVCWVENGSGQNARRWACTPRAANTASTVSGNTTARVSHLKEWRTPIRPCP